MEDGWGRTDGGCDGDQCVLGVLVNAEVGFLIVRRLMGADGWVLAKNPNGLGRSGGRKLVAPEIVGYWCSRW